jgi:hypothetical protein
MPPVLTSVAVEEVVALTMTKQSHKLGRQTIKHLEIH